MSILKIILILVTIVASISARRGRRYHQQRGRDASVAEAGATPEAAESNDIISEAIAEATEQHDVVADTSALSAPEAAQSGSVIVASLAEAVAIAAEMPQAQEVQAEVVEQKVDDTYYDLGKALNYAKKYQRKLTKYGATMTTEDVTIAYAKLQKYLELALHFALQNDAATQQQAAIEDGASPVEVAEIAPAAIAVGRAMRG